MRQYLRLVRLPANRRQRAVVKLVARAMRDDRGGEAMEYAIVTGLLVVGAIATISCVGNKVAARWSSINSGM